MPSNDAPRSVSTTLERTFPRVAAWWAAAKRSLAEAEAEVEAKVEAEAKAKAKAQKNMDRNWHNVPSVAPHVQALATELAWNTAWTVTRKKSRFRDGWNYTAWRPEFKDFVKYEVSAHDMKRRVRRWMRATPNGRGWAGKANQLLMRAVFTSDAAAVEALLPFCDCSLQVEVAHGEHPCQWRRPGSQEAEGARDSWCALELAAGNACPDIVKLLAPATPATLVERALLKLPEKVGICESRGASCAAARGMRYLRHNDYDGSRLAEIARTLAARMPDDWAGADAVVDTALHLEQVKVVVALCERWPQCVSAAIIFHGCAKYCDLHLPRRWDCVRELLSRCSPSVREEALGMLVESAAQIAESAIWGVKSVTETINRLASYELSASALSKALALWGESALPDIAKALAKAEAKEMGTVIATTREAQINGNSGCAPQPVAPSRRARPAHAGSDPATFAVRCHGARSAERFGRRHFTFLPAATQRGPAAATTHGRGDRLRQAVAIATIRPTHPNSAPWGESETLTMNTTLPDEITRPARSYTARGFVIGALVLPAASFVIWLALLAFHAAGVSLGVGATLSVVWSLIPGMSLSMWINMADDAGCVGLCRGYIMGASATGALVCGVLCLVLASTPNPTSTAQAPQYTSAVSSPRH